MSQSSTTSRIEHEKRQAARTKYNGLIAGHEQDGKPLTRRDQKRIVYEGRAGGIIDEVIMQALRELGVTEITTDLPIPKVTQSIPVVGGDSNIVVMIPKPVRQPAFVGG